MKYQCKFISSDGWMTYDWVAEPEIGKQFKIRGRIYSVMTIYTPGAEDTSTSVQGKH